MGTVTLNDLSKKRTTTKKNHSLQNKPVNKRKSLKHFEESYKNINLKTKEKIDDSIDELKRELLILQEENKILRNGDHLTKNEKKIITAIKSEMIEQETDKPIISTSMLRKKYRVSAKYQGESVKALTDKNIIKREKTSYSGQVKTYRWILTGK